MCVSLFSPCCPRIHSVNHIGLELIIPLSQHPKYYNYKCVLPCPAKLYQFQHIIDSEQMCLLSRDFTSNSLLDICFPGDLAKSAKQNSNMLVLDNI